MHEYDILSGNTWGRKTVSYGFNPDIPLDVRDEFHQAAEEITANTSFTVFPELTQKPDVLISFGETEGYLALAHLPGFHEISGDIILSKELMLEHVNWKQNIFREELAHSVTGILHTQRQDSIMSYNLAGVSVTDVPTTYTPFDYWAMEANNHLVPEESYL